MSYASKVFMERYHQIYIRRFARNVIISKDADPISSQNKDEIALNALSREDHSPYQILNFQLTYYVWHNSLAYK
jgi:hypothetical protein